MVKPGNCLIVIEFVRSFILGSSQHESAAACAILPTAGARAVSQGCCPHPTEVARFWTDFPPNLATLAAARSTREAGGSRGCGRQTQTRLMVGDVVHLDV